MPQRSFKHTGKTPRPKTQTPRPKVNLPQRQKTQPPAPKPKTQPGVRIPGSGTRTRSRARTRIRTQAAPPSRGGGRQPSNRTTQAMGRGTQTDFRGLNPPPKQGMDDKTKMMLVFGGSFAALFLLVIVGFAISAAGRRGTAPLPKDKYRPPTTSNSPRRHGVNWKPAKAKPLPELGGKTMAEYMKEHNLDENQMLKERQRRLEEFQKRKKK